MKMILRSRQGSERNNITLEVVGGYTPEVGRWERIRTPSGKIYLIKGRAIRSVWELASSTNKSPRPLVKEEYLNPIDSQIPLNWSLFTMNFLSWPDTRYRGVAKMRARWCDQVELSAPAVGPQMSASYTKALVYLDIEFGAPLTAELYDADGRLLKTVRAVSIKKVERTPFTDNTDKNKDAQNNSKGSSEWILKNWEVVDAVTHSKVSIEVQSVALDQSWSKIYYDEANNEWPDLSKTRWKTFE
jgi:hypothetical protein